MTKSLGEKILKKIKKGKIKMKSKSYFVFRTALFVIGVILVFIFIIFLISFIIFILRTSGVGHFPAFGFRGLRIFLVSFPWLLMILAVIFILILEVFARRFSIVYRKPLLYSALGIVVIALLLGLVIAQTPMHKRLFQSAQEGKLPVFGPFYKGYHMRVPDNVYFGEVSSITDDGFEIETKQGESLSVIISSKTRLPFNEDIQEGDSAVVIGERDNSTIKAFGVRCRPLNRWWPNK